VKILTIGFYKYLQKKLTGLPTIGLSNLRGLGAMARAFDGIIPLNKPLIAAAILLVVIAGLLLIRQVRQTVADNGPTPPAASVQTSIHSPQASESSINEDSLNSTPSNQSSGSSNHSSLSVNGQDIPLPANGSINQTLVQGDTTTTINAQRQSGSNSSSLKVQVNSNSSSKEGQ